MKQHPENFSIFINSLLCSKEIRIDHDHENIKTVQITESSVFGHSKKIVPMDLISPEPSIAKHPNKQWLLFGVLSLFAASLFLIMAISLQFTAPYIFSTGFALSALFSVYAANKHHNKSYTYQCRETGTTLFSLTENDINREQLTEFIGILNHNILKSINNGIEPINNIQNRLNIAHLSNQHIHQTSDLDIFYQHLGFLYEEGIINEDLLKELELRAYNKVNDIPDTRPLAKVIPLHANL